MDIKAKWEGLWYFIAVKIDQGYAEHDTGACQPWADAWEGIKQFMVDYNQATIESMDAFFLEKNIFADLVGWVADYETALANASIKDSSYTQKRVVFCQEVISRLQSLDTITGFKQGLADAYFRMGVVDKGEEVYKSNIALDPCNAWNWVQWSDQYWLFVYDEQKKDGDKAVAILLKALDVDGIEDEVDIYERLLEIYQQTGQEDEATKIKLKIARCSTQ